MSAVSNSVMPRSIALWITLREASRSVRWPKLLQPRPTAETRRPEPPRLRICMIDALFFEEAHDLFAKPLTPRDHVRGQALADHAPGNEGARRDRIVARCHRCRKVRPPRSQSSLCEFCDDADSVSSRAITGAGAGVNQPGAGKNAAPVRRGD